MDGRITREMSTADTGGPLEFGCAPPGPAPKIILDISIYNTYLYI
jgi:hypothetical protein